MACPVCRYPNDESFKFCQNCGYKRRLGLICKASGKRLRFPINEHNIQARIYELENTRTNSRYQRQKSSLEVEFAEFLWARSPPKDIKTALPSDVLAFLVWKDQGG